MLLGVLLAISSVVSAKYVIPPPKFQVLRPRGFRVSIPDESGIRSFTFHGNVNKDLNPDRNGMYFGDVLEKTNGKWIFENKKVKVKKGDVINYYIFVFKNGIGHMQRGGYQFDANDVEKAYKKMRTKRGVFSKFYKLTDDFPGYHYGPPGHHHPKFNYPDYGGYFAGPYDFPPGHQHGVGHWGHHHHHHHHNKHCGGSNENGDNKEQETISSTTTSIPTTEVIVTIPSTIPTAPPTTTTSVPDIDIRFGGSSKE